MTSGRPDLGAANLLMNCVKARAGESLVLVTEGASSDHYDRHLPHIIAEVANELGCRVRIEEARTDQKPDEALEDLKRLIEGQDHAVILNRLGDRVRFNATPPNTSMTMVYALDRGLLGSPFGVLQHGLMRDIKNSFEDCLDQSGTWRITCPLGTDLSGSFRPAPRSALDFSVDLFPVPTFKPVPCDDAEGRVAVAHWLMGTDVHAYGDDILLIEEPIFAVVKGGRIRGYEGPARVVSKVKEHYRRVAEMFGLDETRVGSWHAGIHPKAYYPVSARANLARWGSVAFANPRYLHFHTCGTEPGEISWSLFDSTITLDGQTFYEEGQFVYLETPRVAEICRAYETHQSELAMIRDIGID